MNDSGIPPLARTPLGQALRSSLGDELCDRIEAQAAQLRTELSPAALRRAVAHLDKRVPTVTR